MAAWLPFRLAGYSRGFYRHDYVFQIEEMALDGERLVRKFFGLAGQVL
jgi:hypothetical protein